MKRTYAAIAGAALAASTLAFAPPADAPCVTVANPATVDPDDTVDLCEATAYFRSSNPAKVDNLSSVGATDFPTWSAGAPASVTTGSGEGFAGQYQTSLVTGADSTSGVTYVGTFEGALDNLAIEQYAFTAAQEINGVYGIVLTLSIDGSVVYESDFIEGNETAIESGGSAVKVFRFAVTDLLGAATVDAKQAIEINITPYFVGDEAVFVYDAAEAPSNVTFNARDLGKYTTLSAS